MGKRKSLPQEDQPQTLPLFDLPEDSPEKTIWPRVRRDEAGFFEVLENSGGRIGFDLEFSPYGKPTIIGIANRSECAALRWSEQVAGRLVDWIVSRGGKLVAYSGITADKPILESVLGREIPLRFWSDSMIRHYLINADLCSIPGKEEDEGTSLGFMNLWTALTFCAPYPNWKEHRGAECWGPCPKCDPFWYCGMDAFAALIVDQVNADRMRLFGIPEKVFEERQELAELCYLMEKQGIRIDTDFVRKFDSDLETRQAALFPDNQPFNPRSPKAVTDWFAARGILLPSCNKKDVMEVLKRYARSRRVLFEELEEMADALPEQWEVLYRLYMFKNMGKGADAWFGEKYLKDGFAHPRFIVTGTSSGRLSSSRPNFQNIPIKGWGSAIKKAVVPISPDRDIVEVDASQLELRMVIYLSGQNTSVLGKDAFMWLVENSGGLFDEAAKSLSVEPRYIAKTVSHAADYLEGFCLIDPYDLEKKRVKDEIKAGALRVYRDWTFFGRVVGFNGVNLAERLFGNRSWEARAKALNIQENIYFARFPWIRDWQRRVLQEVEARGYVQSPTGRILRLYGRAEDQAKQAAAFFGQGVSADHVQGIMLRFWREYRRQMERREFTLLIQVHDSLVWEIPKDWSNNKIREFLSYMFEETDRLPGFAAPGKIKRGPNYGELAEI